MSGELMAKTRFKYLGNSYLISAYHDSYEVRAYKVQRETSEKIDASPAYEFDPIIKGHTPYIPEDDLWNLDEIPRIISEYEMILQAPPAYLKLKLKTNSDEICIEVEDTEAEQPQPSSQLLIKGLTQIIVYTASDEWIDSAGEVPQDQYLAALLQAVATNYYIATDLQYQGMTYADVLTELISWLLEMGHLGQIPLDVDEAEDFDG